MQAAEVFGLDQNRFTIEFLIRDIKQSGGLADCQARDNKALEFHWKASLTAVNLGTTTAQSEKSKSTEKKPFSMKPIKQQFFNEPLLNLFIGKTGFEQSLIKYKHPD